jgi:hypothetical protein
MIAMTVPCGNKLGLDKKYRPITKIILLNTIA